MKKTMKTALTMLLTVCVCAAALAVPVSAVGIGPEREACRLAQGYDFSGDETAPFFGGRQVCASEQTGFVAVAFGEENAASVASPASKAPVPVEVVKAVLRNPNMFDMISDFIYVSENGKAPEMITVVWEMIPVLREIVRSALDGEETPPAGLYVRKYPEVRMDLIKCLLRSDIVFKAIGDVVEVMQKGKDLDIIMTIMGLIPELRSQVGKCVEN